MYVVEAVMNSAVEVKRRKGDLVEVSKQQFTSLYPQLADFGEHGTVMCPPIFSFGYKAPIGKASGAASLSRIEEDSLRGDTAELKIFKMLEKCNLPMFVIANLKWSNFIQEVVQQRLPENHPSLSYVAEALKTAKEVDFAIIHRKIGVILFEVKAKFRKDAYRKAKDQLKEAEKFIQALLLAIRDEGRTSEMEIPILKVVAMPNDKTYNSHATAREPTLDSSKSGTKTGCEKVRAGEAETALNSDRASSKPDFIDLRQENLDSLDKFLVWWREQFVEREFDKERKQALHTLLSIFVSQRTEITCTSPYGGKELSDDVLPHKMLARIYNEIDNQSFLEQSHNKVCTKNPKKKLKVVDPVVRTSDKPNLGILEKKFLFLNREQLEIWEGPYRQVFNGAPGCGKTILLQFKALECARKGEKVQIFVPDPLMNLYTNFFCGQQNVYVLQLGNLGGEIDHDSHCFVDEFQLVAMYVDTEPSGKQGRNLRKNLESKGKDLYFWIAGNDVQFFPCTPIPGFESQLWGWFSEKLEELETMAEFYCPTEMKTVVRCTHEIHDFVQEYLSKAGISRPEGATAVDSINLGHQIRGPPVKVLNLQENFSAANCAKLIKEKIEGWTNYNDIAVLVSSAFPQRELFDSLSNFGIPVCNVGSNENAVVIDSVVNIHSYQWLFVIVVSKSSPEYSVQNYTMFTRAVAKLVVINYS